MSTHASAEGLGGNESEGGVNRREFLRASSVSALALLALMRERGEAALSSNAKTGMGRYREILDSDPALSEFCEKTAESIGGDITPERIARVIVLSREGEFLFHGVKNLNSVAPVTREGVKPLAPEHGNASVWTTGQRTFGTRENGAMFTDDSTFFNYAHSHDPTGNAEAMTIVVTKPRNIQRATGHRIALGPKDYIAVPVCVPPEAMQVLHVSQQKRGEDRSPREWGQLAEQRMFSLMEEAVSGGYHPGTRRFVRPEDQKSA